MFQWDLGEGELRSWVLPFQHQCNQALWHQTKHFSSVQSLGCVRLFATPWTAACQASLSITNSQNLPKVMSFESMMPSNHLILCHPLLLLPSTFPSIRVWSLPVSQFFTSGGQSIGASASVLPVNIQDNLLQNWLFDLPAVPSLIIEKGNCWKLQVHGSYFLILNW